ncbi:glycosyltransferase family 4 protein [Wenxinia saemankumensis]|uniref:Glycosyltransferase involved in cell wall bisynthesis n=1 Tax=Wenxinia saemankumensis TaxID=1447782 RepID=A0A1M6G094_9RHOB|nr:glycosyltransferase family 4 protein [Wenxinia saemankumensis]SHJ03284.1 Glycosyltransferase involved in cell wall bisynthesis [Wenxinia saemankumensis]
MRDVADAPRAALRIAYLCDQSPDDHGSYSGGNARLRDALAARGAQITELPLHWGAAEPLRRAVQAMPASVRVRAFWRARLAAGGLAAAPVNRALRAGRFDAVFCPYAFHALLGVRPPPGTVSVHTSDATPAIYRDSEVGRHFGSYLRASRLLDPLIEAAERRVFRSTDLLLWPSRWLAEAATARYGLDPGRSLHVPWGANVPDPGPAEDPPRLGTGPTRLLIVGRQWEAKGGPLVLRILQRLRAEGADVRLDVVGCDPPDARAAPGVTVHGHLDKADPAQFADFTRLFRSAHFLVMPSFESYGFAFCEASAYGLPSLCYDVGGVPVREGRNGHALPADARAADFAARVTAYLADPAAYDALRLSSRREYETRLNWTAWADRTLTLIRAAAATRAAGVAGDGTDATAPDPAVAAPRRRAQ